MSTQDSKEHIQTLENGREYYGNEKIAYLLPHDIDECGRLEKQHSAFRYIFQKNFWAPVRTQLEEGITVLDSGCGPGSWTLDMAKDFPNSKFHGVDVSNVFPDETKPDNCEFIIGNLTETLPFEDNTFDYVHQRLLILGLTNSGWEKCLSELLRVLKPGGYIEIHEPNMKDLFNGGPLLEQVHIALAEMMESRDIPITIATELKNRVTETGFVNAVETLDFLPLNHGGRGGELIWSDYYHGYMNIRPMMAKSNPKWGNLEAYETFLGNCASEANTKETNIGWYTIYAQKTLN
ncbi:S-adenosyl-L-methionine-dependent methyltransferase [Thamnidium elegans]|nr:S-adenosyl-L-methionine-dependent methyltransferase [Thamnidium elegans]